ncbi:MAG: transcriptional regulator [Acidobacteria bacterium]|nr:transcriptional regulator [Acidobacteriota bacterium]
MNKTSDTLGNSFEGRRSAADRLLELLKRRGPQTAAELGAALGVTDEAARQQLVKLGSEGLVEGFSENRGVGRPKQVWKLTAAGNGRFPDAHAELTEQLISTIRKVLGEESLDRLIAAREAETLKNYLVEMEGAFELEDRVRRLAAIRDREGYMCEFKTDGDGYLLIENHCPICAAANTCQGFCRSELRIFEKVLGEGVMVTREEHIVSGARRCAYRIVGQYEKTRR